MDGEPNPYRLDAVQMAASIPGECAVDLLERWNQTGGARSVISGRNHQAGNRTFFVIMS
jgi:hypothetical protein